MVRPANSRSPPPRAQSPRTPPKAAAPKRAATDSPSPAAPGQAGCGCGPEVPLFLGALDGLVRAGLISIQVRDEVLALLQVHGAFCPSDNGGVGEGLSPVAVDPFQRTVTYDGNVAAGPGNYRSYHGYRILC